MRHHQKGIQGRYCRFPTAARWLRCEQTGFALPVAQVWAAHEERRANHAIHRRRKFPVATFGCPLCLPQIISSYRPDPVSAAAGSS